MYSKELILYLFYKHYDDCNEYEVEKIYIDNGIYHIIYCVKHDDIHTVFHKFFTNEDIEKFLLMERIEKINKIKNVQKR